MNTLTQTPESVKTGPSTATDEAFDQLRQDLRAIEDADIPTEDWNEYDRWSIDVADRLWWASQDTEGGMVEGEGDRSAIELWTEDAWTWRLDRMAEALETQARYEAGFGEGGAR